MKRLRNSPLAHDLNRLLAARGFPPLKYLKIGETISDHFEQTNRPGLYTLLFSTQEVYLGQSVQAHRGFREHSKTYNDITAVSFRAVALDQLDVEEELSIKHLERNGILVRNSIHASRTIFQFQTH